MSILIAHDSTEQPRDYSIEEFEEIFQFRYLPHLQFADWRVEQSVRAKCQKAHDRGKVGQLALWLGKFHRKVIETATIPDVTVRWISEPMGFGLFTNRPIEPWEFMGEYTGLLRRRAIWFPNINDYCFMYPREWIATKAFTIDSEKQGNFTRFINHSDHPNLESLSLFYDGIFHVVFRAIKPIPVGAELTYDYGDVYWRRRKKIASVKTELESQVSPEELPTA